MLPYQDTIIPTVCDIWVASAYIPKIRGCQVHINRVFLAWWMAENKCQGYLFPCQPLHYCIVLEHQTHYQSEKRMPVFPFSLFSLLLMEEWIMFPIVRRWNAQRHPAPETKVSPISHLGLQDSWMTRYTQTKTNPSAIPDNRMFSIPQSKWYVPWRIVLCILHGRPFPR